MFTSLIMSLLFALNFFFNNFIHFFNLQKKMFFKLLLKLKNFDLNYTFEIINNFLCLGI